MLRRGLVFLAFVFSLAFVSCEQPANNDPADGVINAQTPNITGQPQSGTWDVTTADTFSLTITASVTDGGTLSYQWYFNLTDAAADGTAMPGATNAALTLAKANYTGDGPWYFYVVVTNTINDNGDGGNKTASVTSTVTVMVTGNGVAAVNAQQPVITAHPAANTAWNVFAADTVNLTVGASVVDGGILSYQWYATLSPAIITFNNPVTTGGTSATLSLSREHYTTDNARSYFFVQIKNTNANVNGIQTATVNSSVATVTVTGNEELAYTTTPFPQSLIGQWIDHETITISATEFSSQIQGWSDYDYKGTIVGHRSNSDGAGYITIQYTQHYNTGAIGKYYVIHYKELESTSMKYSSAYLLSDPGFANSAGGGKATQDEAEKTYTVTCGYFELYTLVVKVP